MSGDKRCYLFRYITSHGKWSFIAYNNTDMKGEAIGYSKLETWTDESNGDKYDLLNVCYSKEKVDSMVNATDFSSLFKGTDVFVLFRNKETKAVAIVWKPRICDQRLLEITCGEKYLMIDQKMAFDEITQNIKAMLNIKVQVTVESNVYHCV
jgi:hypothetical protein